MRVKDDKKIEQIFNGSLELIEQFGIAGITMSDISKKAGIATGTLYIYFKNKEELINELFSVCRKQSAAFYFHDYLESDSTETGLKKIFYNIISFRHSHFKESVFLEQYYHSPYVNEKKRIESSRHLQPFYQSIEKGQQLGVLKKGGKPFIFMVYGWID